MVKFICATELSHKKGCVILEEKYELSEKRRIFFYSDYLKERYGEKVYKLPINVAGGCPNRDGRIASGGCIYCAGAGGGYDCLSDSLSIKEQLEQNMNYIGKKYKAKKFIAYFQNYTGTYLPVDDFKKNINEAALDNIAEISVSTRPDCLAEPYLDAMLELSRANGINMSIELGLQTANYHTLKKINRGHGLAEFIRAVILCKKYNFSVCAHAILNLPWDDRSDVAETARIMSALEVDGVKLHSLNILKDTELARMYEAGEVEEPKRDEYVERALIFLRNTSPSIAVHRLIGRAPEEISVVENFNNSWRSVYDEIVSEMKKRNLYQGMDIKEEICL